MEGTWRQSAPIWLVVAMLVLVVFALVMRKQCPATSAAPANEKQPASEDTSLIAQAVVEEPSEDRVRPSPIAGSWYSDNRDRLHRELREFLSGADEYHGPRPLGLVCPHAGYRFSGATAAYAFRALEEERYDRVFILGPSHGQALTGLGIGNWTHYETPLGNVPIDTAAVERLSADDMIAVIDKVDAREHSVEMEVPFLQVVAMGSRIVPMVVGHLDRAGIEHVAGVLRQEVGPGDLVVASSDFTHYGDRFSYQPDVGEDRQEGIRELDMGAYDAFASLDLGRFLAYKQDTGITVCGYRPMAILLAMLSPGSEVKLAHYDTSGRMTGDWKNSVSYVSAVATGTAWGGRGADDTTWRFDRDEQQTLLKLARDSIRARLDGQSPPDLADYTITDEMREDSGAFVTLTIEGHLRGCIGEIPSTRPLAEVIREHAVDAAFRDPRFSALTEDEFDLIEIDISALTAPEAVASHEDIVLGRDGVYLIKGMRRAVYLPQVAVEQGWDLDETLSSLSRKAGLPLDGWKEGARFEVFQAQVFHE